MNVIFLCPVSLFDYCVHNPTSRVQNPDNCGQYYDCRSQFEEVVNNCPHSHLYDVDSRTCRHHDLVDCYGRPVLQEKTSLKLQHVSSMQNNITHIQTDIFSRQRNIVHLQNNITSRQKNVTKLQNSITHRQNNITEIQSSITKIQSGITKRQNIITHRQANITAIHKSIANIQNDIASRHHLIKSIQNLISSRQANITSIYNSIDHMQKELTSILNSTGNHTSPISSSKLISSGKPQIIFSPSAFINVLKKLAVKTGSKDIDVMCQGGYHKIVFKQDNCAQYINCSNPNSRLGKYIEECNVGFLFDRQSLSCRPFHQVSCSSRYEPKQVCDYKRVCQELGGDGSCDKCYLHYKSCDMQASNALPLRISPTHLYHGFQNRYVYCVDQRAVGVVSCPEGQYYNHFSGICSSELKHKDIQQICQESPNRTLSHPLDCEKYILCNTQVTMLNSGAGSFTLGECPYALLFSGEECHNFDIVTCGKRKEPVTPCEYSTLSNCGSKGKCEPEACERRYPSCKQLPDGHHPHPGKILTEHFIACYHGRTIGLHNCVDSLFDPVSKECGLSMKVVLAAAVKVPGRLCEKYPTALLPHPTECDRFLNCSSATFDNSTSPTVTDIIQHAHRQPDANTGRYFDTVKHSSAQYTGYEYCPPSYWFNVLTRQCEVFVDVYQLGGCYQSSNEPQ